MDEKKENDLKKSIREWAEADRPREKLIDKGRQALSDAELLAILLGSGNKDESAVDLSRRILQESDNSLYALGKMSIAQLIKFKGIGEAKAITIAAALELGRRRKAEEVKTSSKIKSSSSAFEYMSDVLADLPHEEFWALYLDRANKPIKRKQISSGGFSATVVDPKIVFKNALELSASGIILFHNHPSGNLQPSEQDNRITEKLKQAGALLEISVIDHLIVGHGNSFYSYADEGKL